MSVVPLLEKPAVQMAAAMILPNIGGWIGGIKTKQEIEAWYKTLKFPKYRPPNWVFGPVWTALYTSMGYASYVVWKQGNGFSGPARIPLILYGAQLALNWAWTPIFFGRHDLKWSSVEILALTATAAATGLAFYNIDKTAGLIFVPYLIWLSFASYLNISIYRLNTPAIEDKKTEGAKEK